MTSRSGSGNTVEAGVPPALQSGSQPRRLRQQKTDIRIRDAKLNDAPELAVLMCELSYETKRAEMETRLKLILSNPAYKTFVAVMGGRVCGMIGTLTYPSYEHNELSGRIIALVVTKRQRRSGIGRTLLVAAERDFAQRKITRVSLTTRFTREDAHRFYGALGYSRTGFRFGKNLSSPQAKDG